MSFLVWLVDSSEFMTRNHCGPGWTDGLVWAQQAFNAVIAVSYFFIPWSLYHGVRFRRRFPEAHAPILVWVAFIAFIVSCGVTHVADVVVFYWPAYRLFTLVDACCALLSFCTAMSMPIVGAYMRWMERARRRGRPI